MQGKKTTMGDGTSPAPTTLRGDPNIVLLQGDFVVFDPPQSLEPDVDVEHIEGVWMDENVLCCAKNGAIPVAEGGRYAKNTLCAVLACRRSDSIFQPCRRVTHDGAADAADTFDAGHRVVHTKKRLRDDASPSSSDKMESDITTACGGDESTVGELLPVHRLDRETSGLTIFARHKASAAFLARQFHHEDSAAACVEAEPPVEVNTSALQPAKMEAVKEYEALLAGVVTDAFIQGLARVGSLSGVSAATDHATAAVSICVPIGSVLAAPAEIPPTESKLSKLRMRCFPPRTGGFPHADEAAAAAASVVVDAHPTLGKYAKTDVSIVATSTELGVTFVRIRIYTGRTHQIRLHCAHLGFPVLGDKLYSTNTPGRIGGGCSVSDALFLKRVRGEVTVQWRTSASNSQGCDDGLAVCVRRQMLHAYKLSVTLPPAHGVEAGGFGAGTGGTSVTRTFTVPAREWFLRDLIPVHACDCTTASNEHCAHKQEALFMMDTWRQLLSA